MSRVTITLSEACYRALDEAAVRREMSIEALIQESLEDSGLKAGESARALVARSRQAADLDEETAQARALEEARRHRH